jgi:alkylation response protein AidB-like acyl-CoA dehydrogenase
MDVRLSPEQQALRDSVAQVVGRLGAKAVGQLDDAERAAKLDAAVTAAGWRELRTASDAGAPWASAVEVAIVAEELGRGFADVAFLGPTLAAELRRLTGAEAATDAETVALDPTLISIAIASDGRSLGDEGAVAIDAAGARSALAVAIEGAEERIARIPLGGDRIEVDITRPSARVAGALEPIAGGSLEPDGLGRWLALGLAITSAELVGTMRGAVDLAVEYAAQRRQFGVAIGSFQAVQHLLADAHVAAEGSRAVSLHAAWAVDALPVPEAVAAAALAKAWCGRAARTVCETAIQVHGGIGNTWDCLAHVHLRRALLSTDVLGGADMNLDRVLAHQGLPHRLEMR